MRHLPVVALSLFLPLAAACGTEEESTDADATTDVGTDAVDPIPDAGDVQSDLDTADPRFCSGDLECDLNEYCGGCISSCDGCDDCRFACQPLTCASEDVLTCRCARPECGAAVAVVRDGCWVCVDPVTCEPVEDTGC
jgi:hypothetical protein